MKEILDENQENVTILHAFYELTDTDVCDPDDDPLEIQEYKYNDVMSCHPGHIPGAKAFPIIAYNNLYSPYKLSCPTLQ